MRLFPDEYCKSFYEYDFGKAFAEGKRLILFDIDNTMVPHGAPADNSALKKINELKDMGFKLMAVSNNKENRVSMFCDKAGVRYICNAAKPSKAGYIKAAESSGVDTGSTIFFGDQIFTDILGANNAGIKSILVKPIDKKTDEFQIKCKRILEKPVIWAFLKDKKLALNEYFS